MKVPRFSPGLPEDFPGGVEFEPEPEVRFQEYPRIAAGTYQAYSTFAKIYRDPCFKRWTCLIRFEVFRNLFESIAILPLWLNLGRAEKPRAGRRSKYLSEWVRAAGQQLARRTGRGGLDASVFRNRMARVLVGDTDPKKSPMPYSVVKEIIAWETGVTQSINQLVNKGGRESPRQEELTKCSDTEKLRPCLGSRVTPIQTQRGNRRLLLNKAEGGLRDRAPRN
jgi:hypothetical protein